MSGKLLEDEEIKSLVEQYIIYAKTENFFKENRRKIRKKLKRLIKDKNKSDK